MGAVVHCVECYQKPLLSLSVLNNHSSTSQTLTSLNLILLGIEYRTISDIMYMITCTLF